MLPLRDDIKPLLRTPIARLQLHRNQIFAEISRGRIYEETLAGRRLDGGGGESACGGIVADVSFSSGGRIENTAGASDVGDVAGVERVGEWLGGGQGWEEKFGVWVWSWEGGGEGEEGESEKLGAHDSYWWSRFEAR